MKVDPNLAVPMATAFSQDALWPHRNVESLLEQKANPNTSLDSGANALMLCADRGESKHLASLLKHGASLNGALPNGISPLYLAAEKGHSVCVALLLDYQADPNLATQIVLNVCKPF